MQSSVDSSQISATVSGAILSASALIVWGAMKGFGVELQADDVAALATQVGAIAGAIMGIYGLIRKVLVTATTPSN